MPQDKWLDQFEDAPDSNEKWLSQFEDAPEIKGKVSQPKKGFISQVTDEYKNKLSGYSGLVTGEKPFIELLPKKAVNKLEPHDSRVLVGYEGLLDNIRNRTTDLAAQNYPEWLAKPMAQFGSLATDAVRTGIDIATDPLNYLGFKGAAGNVGRIYGEGIPKNIAREVIPREQKLLGSGTYHVNPKGEAGVPLATDIPRRSVRERLQTQGDIELKPIKSEVVTSSKIPVVETPYRPTPDEIKNAQIAGQELHGVTPEAARVAETEIRKAQSTPSASAYIQAVKDGTAKGQSFAEFVKRFASEDKGTFDPRALKKNTKKALRSMTAQVMDKDAILNEAKLLGIDASKYPDIEDLQWEITRKTAQRTYDTGINSLTGEGTARKPSIPREEYVEQLKQDIVDNPALDNLRRLITEEEGGLDLSKLKGAFDSKINSRKYKTVYNKIAQTLANGGRLDADFLKSNGKLVDQILASGTLEKDIANIQKVNADQPPIQRLLSILEVNKVNRAEMDALRSKEVGKRLHAFGETFKGDQKSFAMGASKMKGEYEKIVSPVEFQLGQKDTDLLFKQIKDANITNGEKLRTGFALRDLLEGVRTLQPNEIDLMDRIFGNGVGNKIIELHGGLGLTGLKLAKTANTMKSMKASLDLSAPFRQGLGLVHRKEFWRAFKEMGKYATSEEAYQAGQKAIQEHPEYLFSRDSGLFTADHTPGGFEEQFMDSYLNDVHKLMGKSAKFSPFEISERSYTGFLNKLRFDTFNALIEKANKAGRQTFDVVKEADELGNVIETRVPNDLAKQIAHYVNNATGRGSLGSLEKNARGLNNIFFSPRFITSRLTTLNPVYYWKADPFVRKEALKTLFAMGAFTGIAGYVGEFLGGEALRGLPFSMEATSSDYMKPKAGNTRIDPSGGLLPYIVLASRIYQNKTTSTAAGEKVRELGKGIVPNAVGQVVDFGLNRLSPAGALIKALANRENSKDFKEPFSASQEAYRAFEPMIKEDVQDLYNEDPDSVPIGILNFLGMGVQTYK